MKIDLDKIVKDIQKDVSKTIDNVGKEIKKGTAKAEKVVRKNVKQNNNHNLFENNKNNNPFAIPAKASKSISSEIKCLKDKMKCISDDAVKTAIGDVISILTKCKNYSGVETSSHVFLRNAINEIEKIKSLSENSQDAFYTKHVYEMCDSAEEVLEEAIKGLGIELPAEYQLIKKKALKEMNLPEDAKVYGMQNEGTSATVMICKIDDKWTPMNYDDVEACIASTRNSMNESQGIIEVKNGILSSGGKYIYNIVKQAHGTAENRKVGMDYIANFNFDIGDDTYFLNAAFIEEGSTGMRDTFAWTMIRKVLEDRCKREGTDLDFDDFFKNKWSKDSYDESIKNGILMNLSEDNEFDEMFPRHPLSELRALISFVVANN